VVKSVSVQKRDLSESILYSEYVRRSRKGWKGPVKLTIDTDQYFVYVEAADVNYQA
jgi:hypothetical protein